jgi:hypothetical protein
MDQDDGWAGADIKVRDTLFMNHNRLDREAMKRFKIRRNLRGRGTSGHEG